MRLVVRVLAEIGGDEALERIVDVLDRLVLLVAGLEELRALDEDVRRFEVARLQNRAVRRLRMTGFASDLRGLEPEVADLHSCRLRRTAQGAM